MMQSYHFTKDDVERERRRLYDEVEHRVNIIKMYYAIRKPWVDVKVDMLGKVHEFRTQEDYDKLKREGYTWGKTD